MTMSEIVRAFVLLMNQQKTAVISNDMVTELATSLARCYRDEVRNGSSLNFDQFVIVAIGVAESQTLLSVARSKEMIGLTEIMKSTGKSEGWIKNRISQLGREKDAKWLRGTGRGTAGWYYPADIVETLLQISQADGHPSEGWLTVNDLADIVGMGRKWIENQIAVLKPKEEKSKHPRNGITVSFYPPEVAITLINLASKVTDPSTMTWLTRYDLAKELGQGVPMVSAMIQKLKIEGCLRAHRDSGNTGMHYPPQAITLLRSEIAKIPEADDWLSLKELADHLGRQEQWTLHEIQRLKIQPEQRRKKGRVAKRYPPEALILLKASASVPLLGDLLTHAMIAEKLGRSEPWVCDKIPPYRMYGQVRIHPIGHRPTIGYPSWVVDKLKEVSSRGKLKRKTR